MDETWRWSATRTAEAIRRGDLSSREAVEASLLRLEAVEPVINAFGDLAEDALELAAAADEAQARGADLGPLHGVPVAFKESHDISGRATTMGTAGLAAMPPAAQDCIPVERYRAAGAIGLGRTRMPPFGLRWTTDSEFFGPTRNPWDPGVTAGGSSGGAAAAVASGVVPIVQGNDIGGSIRYPAAACGIVGLRPTKGRVPSWSAPPGEGNRLAIEQFFVEGPIARHVEDLRLALDVIAGPDPRDPATVSATRLNGSGRPRIGVVLDVGEQPFATHSTAEVLTAQREAAERLASAGYEVVEVQAPQLGELASLWWQLAMPDFAASWFVAGLEEFADAGMKTKWQNMVDVCRETLGEIGVAEFANGYARRSLLRQEISVLMEDYPVLLLPASGEAPFPHGDDISSPERTRELMRRQWVNLAVPVLGLPAVGMGTHARPGLAPLGVQLMGRAFEEDTVLGVADSLHSATALPVPVDPVTTESTAR